MATAFKLFVMIVSVVVIAYVVAAGAVGRTHLLAILFGPVDRAPVSFETVERRPVPNDYLVCPEDLCRAHADRESPVFDIPVRDLRRRFFVLVDALPRARLVDADALLDQYDVEDRSAVFGFPDTLTVRFMPVGEDRSTVAVYSRSHYGRNDFGLNAQRVTAWLDYLGG